MSHKSPLAVLAFAAAGALGAFAGYTDLHNDEVQAAVLVLLVATFLPALVHPKGGWIIALLAGSCVPIAHLWARATGFALPYPSALPGTLLAFVPAFLGAYAGVLVRKTAALAAPRG